MCMDVLREGLVQSNHHKLMLRDSICLAISEECGSQRFEEF